MRPKRLFPKPVLVIANVILYIIIQKVILGFCIEKNKIKIIRAKPLFIRFIRKPWRIPILTSDQTSSTHHEGQIAITKVITGCACISET